MKHITKRIHATPTPGSGLRRPVATIVRLKGGRGDKPVPSTVIGRRAPCRIDLAGGWTDCPPFADEEGGVVVNLAIAQYAYAEFTPAIDGRVSLQSGDEGEAPVVMGARSLARLREDGRLGLLAAVMKELALGGGRLCTRSDAPRGSGLGASSALEVAAIAAIQSGWGTAATRRAICRTAHDIELGRLHINSGQQDQYAAAFGGISFLRCRSSLRVQRCALEPAVDFARELEDALLLVYTGQTHSSGRILGSVMAAYRRGQPQIVGALRRLKEAGLQMREAVAKGDLPAVGRIMSVNWKAQKALHVPGVTPAIATPAIDAILDAAACEGAFGGKACGAGGGGCVALLVPPGRKTQLARIVEGLGGRVIPCGLDFEGLQPWHSEERQTLCAPREQPGRARVAV